MSIKSNVLYILNNEVKPAIGCTEPVAIALCAAAASSCLQGKTIDSATIHLSPNIFKNAMDVGIPNTSEKGLDVAAALGIAIADYSKGLEILGCIDENTKTYAKKLIIENKIKVLLENTNKKVYLKAVVFSNDNISEALIENKHDNISYIKLNGKTVYESNISHSLNTKDIEDDFFDTPLSNIIHTIENLSFEETKHMLQGIEMNMRVANLGLEKKLGIGVGHSIKENMDKGIIAKDLPNLAMMLTAAASDARMSGLTIPVMSSNGSGNNGLTAILPIAAYNIIYPTDDATLSKALAISHVITSYIKHYIGRLSPLCGCAIAASTGSACAITWLMGGTKEQIQGTVKNILANQSGVICDGAKSGCALKLGTAAASGIQSSLLALSDYYSNTNIGIVTGTAEESIKNLKILSDEGMKRMDSTIIDIMIKNKQDINHPSV